MSGSTTRPLIGKAVQSILTALSDGGFNIYRRTVGRQRHGQGIHGAELADSIRTRAWRASRERILALGGIQAANGYVKINLSLFGLLAALLPHRPPEVVLLRSVSLRCRRGRAPS